MKRFNEQSLLSQLSTLTGMISAVGIPLVATLVWAADRHIDGKYATDYDLKAVQKTVQAQFDMLKKSVDKNTESVQQTLSSVDNLALVVLDLQIAKIEDEVQELDRAKRQGVNWNDREERNLREHQKTLRDLNVQRNVLFNRLRKLPI